MRRTYVDPEAEPWRHLGVLLCPQRNIYQMLAEEVMASHDTVLEVGFGTGAQVAQFAHKVNWVTATEIDPKAVAFAEQWWPLPNVEWLEADICEIAPSVKGYSVILCFEVLEHTEDPEQAISNMADSLRGAGTAYISVPFNDPLTTGLHKWTWSPRDFKDDLSTYFKTVEVSTHGRIIFARCSHA